MTCKSATVVWQSPLVFRETWRNVVQRRDGRSIGRTCERTSITVAVSLIRTLLRRVGTAGTGTGTGIGTALVAQVSTGNEHLRAYADHVTDKVEGDVHLRPDLFLRH